MSDLLPACPRCGDGCALSASHCPTCGALLRTSSRHIANSRRRRERVGNSVTRDERALHRATETATVSYERDDGLTAALVGFGDSLLDRVADADSQLPPGRWLRKCVSTPISILGDLRGRDAKRGQAYPHLEGRWV